MKQRRLGGLGELGLFCVLGVLALLVVGCREPPAPRGTRPVSDLPIVASVASFDGTEIVYEVRGRGDTTVVFLHCWACSREMFREQLDVFARNHRVVSFDFPGHGESGTRQASTVEGLAGDVEAVLDAVGVESAVLVGHSMGGPVALAAAARMPERVLGIVCLDTLHNVGLEIPDALVGRMNQSLTEDYDAFMSSVIGGMLGDTDPELAELVLATAQAADHVAVSDLFRSFAPTDQSDLLAAAGVPVRCVQAAPPGGPEVDLEGNQALADFEYVAVEGVGHYLQLEKPEEVNLHIARALAELSVEHDQNVDPEN